MSGSRSLALAALASVLLATACATPYVPTERMRRLRATMDPADAANLFADSMGRTLKGAGLCKAPWRFDDPKTAVTMDAFTVQAWRPGEELERKEEGGRTLIRSRKDRYEVTGRFADIGRIVVARDASGACARSVPLGQSAIALHGGGEAFPIVIAVNPPTIDELLAALALLAPQASLVEGP